MPPPCAKGTLWFTPSPLQRVFSSWGDYWGWGGGLLSMSVKTQQPHPPPMGLWVAKTLSVHVSLSLFMQDCTAHCLRMQ
jgi:hypothetical protein